MTTPLYFEDCLQLRRLTARGDSALINEAPCVVVTDLGIPERTIVWCSWDDQVETLLRTWNCFYAPRAKVELAALQARYETTPSLLRCLPLVRLTASGVSAHTPPSDPAKRYVPGAQDGRVDDWNATVGEGVPVLFRPFGKHEGSLGDYALRLTAHKAHLQGAVRWCG